MRNLYSVLRTRQGAKWPKATSPLPDSHYAPHLTPSSPSGAHGFERLACRFLGHLTSRVKVTPVPPFPRLKRGPDKQPLLSLKLLESCPSLPSNTRRPKISPSAEEPKNCKPLLWSAKDDNSPGDRRLFVKCIILQPLKLITDPRQKQTVKAVTVLEEHICIQKSRQDLFIPAS